MILILFIGLVFMDYKMVSVIVPIYNIETFLPHFLDSLLSQTYCDFEGILIDDGSTDNSGVIADEYALKDSRLKVYHQSNAGVSTARNKGIDYSRGRYLYFADGDDTMLPNCLETFYSNMVPKVDAVVAGYERVMMDGSIAYRTSGDFNLMLPPRSLLSSLYKPRYYYDFGMTWMIFYKSDIIKKNHLRFQGLLFEDALFLANYLLLCKQDLHVVSTPVYRYLVNRPGSIENSRPEVGRGKKLVLGFKDRVRMYELFLEYKVQGDVLHQSIIGVHYSFDLMQDFFIKNNMFNELKQEKKLYHSVTNRKERFCWILRKFVKKIFLRYFK